MNINWKWAIIGAVVGGLFLAGPIKSVASKVTSAV